MPGPVPTASWNVTRAHVYLPRAKLSAQLSSRSRKGRGVMGGDLGGNVRGGGGHVGVKQGRPVGSVQGTEGLGGSQGELEV